MRAAVIVFPGSNCDRDVATALERVAGAKVQKVWHGESTLPQVDLVVLPGGFSYGDYLRCGAIAAHSAIMGEVKRHAERGGLVLGICNGFQILTEAQLLPGALLTNRGQTFLCKEVFLRVEQADSAFTSGYTQGEVINIPIAHHDGNYFADGDTLKRIEDNKQVAFRYADAQGKVDDSVNPNGSLNNIAGIFNASRNVLGLMPHPERHADALTGGADGARMFTSLLHHAGMLT